MLRNRFGFDTPNEQMNEKAVCINATHIYIYIYNVIEICKNINNE